MLPENARMAAWYSGWPAPLPRAGAVVPKGDGTGLQGHSGCRFAPCSLGTVSEDHRGPADRFTKLELSEPGRSFCVMLQFELCCYPYEQTARYAFDGLPALSGTNRDSVRRVQAQVAILGTGFPADMAPGRSSGALSGRAG